MKVNFDPQLDHAPKQLPVSHVNPIEIPNRENRIYHDVLHTRCARGARTRACRVDTRVARPFRLALLHTPPPRQSPARHKPDAPRRLAFAFRRRMPQIVTDVSKERPPRFQFRYPLQALRHRRMRRMRLVSQGIEEQHVKPAPAPARRLGNVALIRNIGRRAEPEPQNPRVAMPSHARA